ncbi:MAG: 50S ribosomal protein L10 [Methanothrix sp.]
MSVQARHTEHVPEWKIREVEDLVERIRSSPVVGLVGLTDIPAKQIQDLRAEMRDIATIKMVRNNISRRAIEKCSDDLLPLADGIEAQTAFIFTEISPFRLAKMLEEKKRPMPIKAGGKAPSDIVIEKGDTPFSPGPMVGKLQSAGIPAAIKSGKVVINETKVVAEEGDIVSAQLAEVLAAMEIFPREVGLQLRAVYEGGLVYRAEDLAIDIDGIISQMSKASAQALGLAVEIGYATPTTITPIIQRAASKARNLVLDCGIPVPSMMEALLAKAASDAAMLKCLAEGGPAAAPAAAPAEKTEEKAEEAEKEESEEARLGGLSALFG